MSCIPNNDNADNECQAWKEFCFLQKWSIEQIFMVEENHRQRLSNVIEGTIDISPHDSQSLYNMLKHNRGSKETIKSIRVWIIDRSHSIIAIGFILAKYIRNQIDPTTANRECTTINSTHQPFTHMLHTIYLINDIFFNCQNASMKGPYTKLIPKLHDQPVNIVSHLFTQLPWIFYVTFKMAKSNAGDQDKIKKIVSIWLNKGLIDGTRANILNSVMKLEAINIPEPGLPLLASPFPLNLPPPNAVMPAVLPVPPRPEFLGLKAPLPLQAPIQPTIDLYKVSVGNMANVLKNALRGNHLRYHPIDLKSSPVLLPQGQLEPARKEARIQEFYKNVDMILGSDSDRDFRN
jgi:hypothetical protein